MNRPRLLALAGELRILAEEIERRVAREDFTQEQLGNLGAVLLNAGAAVAHELKFSRETFAGLARAAWRALEPSRRAN